MNLAEVNFGTYNIHDVGAVLRIFFRELPDPLIPFRLYEPLMEIQRDVSLQIRDRIVAIRSVIEQMPPGHVPLLRYLIRFLQDVEEHSDVNKMTVS